LLTTEKVLKLSLKAALATEQRVPGLGNGCLQDVLWQAELNPRRKISVLSDGQLEMVFNSLKSTLAAMAKGGGRNTEKDLFGQPGAYAVKMCAATAVLPCPRCGAAIIKEAYLGGSVHYYSNCQPR
jgi:formamidopyrimidine-DNA glycosylase